jgi:NAD(P)-dependent dehydrogenase (short-subunit alcohol dehydrogenase family)
MTHAEKIALITGGGTGIGKAVALALVADGYAVVLAGRRQAPLAETVGEAEALGGRALAVPTDISDPLAVDALFAKTRETFGRLDLLFNNAGFGTRGTALEDLTHAQWTSVMDTNINGTFLCTQAAFRIMKAQDPMGGRIINNGSISAHVPRPGSAPYTTSKHAITGLTRATSLDGRKYDIACGQIDIGNAVTDMTEQMVSGMPQADGTVKPEARMDVQHVAEAVVYMAGLPLETNVQFMTVMATKMPFIGRG